VASCTYREAVCDGGRCRRFLGPMNEADYGSTEVYGAAVVGPGQWLGEDYCETCLERLTMPAVRRSRAGERAQPRREGDRG
jgi:hypothetical protein